MFVQFFMSRTKHRGHSQFR